MLYIVSWLALKGFKDTIKKAMNKDTNDNKISAEPLDIDSLTSASSMTEAINIASERCATGRWCYWDDPGSFVEEQKSLIKFAEKEDIRLADEHIWYNVSPDGSVGHVINDEGNEIFEWLFIAEGDRLLQIGE